MNTELRKDCPMRHENGNCMPAGGFCTAVNNPICEALHNAYDTGRLAVDVAEVRAEAIKEFAEKLKEKAKPFLAADILGTDDVDDLVKEMVGAK